MGNCFKCCCRASQIQKEPPKELVILVAGLDGAGKTSLINYLVDKRSASKGKALPTIGFRTVTIKHKLGSVKLYDVGGGKQIRRLWPKYYSDVHGVIYVVDASDHNRIPENAEVFKDLTCHYMISQKPIVLLGNKQDVDGALDELDLIELLNVERIANFVKSLTRVELSSLELEKYKYKKVWSIDESFDWIVQIILKNYESICLKIREDNAKSKRLHRSFKSMRSWPGRRPDSKTNVKDMDEIANNQKYVPVYYPKTHEKVKRKKRKLLKYIFRLHNNKTAPMVAEGQNGTKPPTREDVKQLIRSMTLEDLLKRPQIEETSIIRNNSKLFKRYRKRPRSAPTTDKKPMKIFASKLSLKDKDSEIETNETENIAKSTTQNHMQNTTDSKNTENMNLKSAEDLQPDVKPNFDLIENANQSSRL